MRPQRVSTVGGRGESRYLKGVPRRQQAWEGGEGIHQPARLGPSAHQAQFHEICDKMITLCLLPLDWEEGKQIMYHPHWGTVVWMVVLLTVIPGQKARMGPAQGKGRTGSEAGVCQAEARPCPAADAPSQGALRKRSLSNRATACPLILKVQTASVDCFCRPLSQAPGHPAQASAVQAHLRRRRACF